MSRIRILIVDDIKNTRESIRRILNFNTEIEVVGEANGGSEAIRQTERLNPDIVLMDISMPDMDGIRATELLSYRAPTTSVIIMSFQSETEYMKKAMMAGAKEYIVKPFTGNDIINTILKVYKKDTRKREILNFPSEPLEKRSPARIISLFSTKGGVGKTTAAVNVAVELANRQLAKVLLIDLNLQFGDIASFLNLVPKKTIADLAQVATLKYEEVRFHMLTHKSGVEVLAASTRPEYAELITAEHISQILNEVKPHFDYVICDNVSRFDDISLSGLEVADEIWLVLGMDIPSIKNTKLSLDILQNLNYSHKVKIILNRFDKKSAITLKDIENSINVKVDYTISNEEQPFITALNKGIPLVEAYPNSNASEEIRKIVGKVSEKPQEDVSKNDTVKIKSFQKIFGFGR